MNFDDNEILSPIADALEFETVTIKIRLSDLMRIERLIDETIDASIQRGNRSEPHLNPEIQELMRMYHRVIPEALKPCI